MLPEIRSIHECSPAQVTRIGFLATVSSLVNFEMSGGGESFVAHTAGERTLTAVSSFVLYQCAPVSETCGTLFAGERFLLRMDEGMSFEVLF